MANTHETLSALFSATADAIRAKTGSTDAIVADQFPEAIANMSSVSVGFITAVNGAKSYTIDAAKGKNNIAFMLREDPSLADTYFRSTDNSSTKFLCGAVVIDGACIAAAAAYRSTYLFIHDERASVTWDSATGTLSSTNAFAHGGTIGGGALFQYVYIAW